MANIVTEVVGHNESLTEIFSNATSKIPATPEQTAVAYGTFVIMALLAIFFGSFQSLEAHKKQKERGEKRTIMSMKNITALAAAIFFMIFFEEFVRLFIMGSHFIMGIFRLNNLIRPEISSLIAAAIPKIPFHSHFTQDGPDGDVNLDNFRSLTSEVVCLLCCYIAGAWYLTKKHWIARTFLGISVAMNGIQVVFENSVVKCCIVPCMLLVSDILLVTAATSFEGPIKLFFPQDFFEERLSASNVVKFGYSEIVYPGTFVALLLRFDNSLKRNSNTYFNVAFVAYFMGLAANIFVTHVFKYALPPFLYLMPACVATPMLWALLKGDIKAMFQYEDFPSEEATDTTTSNTKKEE